MLIQCSRCGAPLDVSEGARIVKCNYCNSSHRLQDQRTLAAQTPAGWRPPPVWTPPAHTPYPSEPLNYHRVASSYAWLWVAAASVMVLPMLMAGFWMVRAILVAKNASTGPVVVAKSLSEPEVACQQLANTSFSEGQQAFQKRIPNAAIDKRHARLKLAGCDYDSAYIGWNADGSHIVSVLLSSSKKVDQKAILAKIAPSLGGQLDTKKSKYTANYRGGAILHLSPDARSLRVASEPDQRARTDWQARGEALWAVARHGGLGAKLELSQVQRKLLSGYSLGEVAKVDPDVPITQATAHCERLLPGAVAGSVSDLTIDVFVDHPWFGEVRLAWKNEENGKLETFSVGHPAGVDRLDHQAAVADCLEPVLGKAQVKVTNQLTQERTYQWLAGFPKEHGSVYKTYLWYDLPGGKQRARRFHAILERLDRCGR